MPEGHISVYVAYSSLEEVCCVSDVFRGLPSSTSGMGDLHVDWSRRQAILLLVLDYAVVCAEQVASSSLHMPYDPILDLESL